MRPWGECACFPLPPLSPPGLPGPRSGSAPSSAPGGSSSWGSSWRPQPLYDSSSGPGIPRTFCTRSRSCPYWSLLSCLDSTLSFPPPLLPTLHSPAHQLCHAPPASTFPSLLEAEGLPKAFLALTAWVGLPTASTTPQSSARAPVPGAERVANKQLSGRSFACFFPTHGQEADPSKSPSPHITPAALGSEMRPGE